MADKAEIVIVVALSRTTRAIGNNGGLLWHIPEDLKRFKQLTLGHPIVMGRKTFESILAILGKPLPQRQNIVVTRNPDFTYPDVITAASVDQAIEKARELDPLEIHIGGGAEIYTQVLPYVDKLFVTFIDDAPEADTFFPEFEDMFEVACAHEKKDHNGLSYQWVDYVRKSI